MTRRPQISAATPRRWWRRRRAPSLRAARLTLPGWPIALPPVPGPKDCSVFRACLPRGGAGAAASVTRPSLRPLLGGAVTLSNYSTTTRITPDRNKPSARAALSDTPMTRPRTNGPRSIHPAASRVANIGNRHDASERPGAMSAGHLTSVTTSAVIRGGPGLSLTSA
jgi:hypothetical protein